MRWKRLTMRYQKTSPTPSNVLLIQTKAPQGAFLLTFYRKFGGVLNLFKRKG